MLYHKQIQILGWIKIILNLILLWVWIIVGLIVEHTEQSRVDNDESWST